MFRSSVVLFRPHMRLPVIPSRRAHLSTWLSDRTPRHVTGG